MIKNRSPFPYLMQLVRDNLTTLIMAALLALIIWANAVRQADPPERKEIRLNVEVITPSQDIIADNQESLVQVAIEAPESVIDQLSDPEEIFRAVVDLTGVEFGTHELPIVIQYDRDDPQWAQLRVASTFPDSTTVTLDQILTRQIQVRPIIQGTTAPTHLYDIDQVVLEPQFIDVEGPSQKIKELSYAEIDVPLAQAKETVAGEGRPRFYDSDGNPQSVFNNAELFPSHNQVAYTVPVLINENFAEISIEVEITGTVGQDYRYSGVTVAPSTILVQGQPAVIDALESTSIKTEPVDISGLDEDYATEIGLQLPSGVSVADGQLELVSVEVDVELILDVEIFVLEPQLIGVSEAITPTLTTKTVSVNVEGPASIIEALTEDDISVVVDLFNQTESGEFGFEPDVRVPEQRGIEVRSVQPSTIVVVIEATETITETETGLEDESFYFFDTLVMADEIPAETGAITRPFINSVLGGWVTRKML